MDLFVIDTLVHNLQDVTLQQTFFQAKTTDLTLAKVVEAIKIMEAGKKQVKEVQSCNMSRTNIASIHYAADGGHRSRSMSRRSPSSQAGSSSSPRSKQESGSWRDRSSSSASSNSRQSFKHNSRTKKGRESKSSKNKNNRGSRVYQARSPTPARRRRVSSDASSGDECNNCGNQHGRDWCPAVNKLCHSCGKKGHFAYKCRK